MGIQLHELDETGPGLRLSIGVTRSGKSHGVKKQVFRSVRVGVPVMALDRMFEWKVLPPDIAELAVGIEPMPNGEGVELAAKWIEQGARFVIVRTRDVMADGLAACRWVRDTPGHCGLAITEVHRVAPNTGAAMNPDLEDVALTWGHEEVMASFWCDTQRLIKLHHDFTENVRELRIYGIGGQLDLQRLKEWGGNELAAAAKECAVRLKAGEPGWHVKIETVALPPYVLEREQA